MVSNNKGFTLIENLVAAALFSVLVLQLILVAGNLEYHQWTYKNMTTAAQIAETIAGEVSAVGVGYKWFKTGKIHERYFDQNGNETQDGLSKFKLSWTVTADKPITGMRVANFNLSWEDFKKTKDLSFRIAR